MAKYYQQCEIVDYYTGLQNVTVFFADTLASLYDFETPGTEVDCLTIGALEESLESGTGVFEKSSLKLTLFEQAIKDTTDQTFVDFILQARDESIHRFAHVANSLPAGATISNTMFFGKVVPKMSANDSDWDSEDYEETINPTREWEVEITSLGVEMFLKLKVKQVLDNVLEDNPTLAEDKPFGSFKGKEINRNDDRLTTVDYEVKDLINLNELLDLIFEECASQLLIEFGITLTIEAIPSILQMKFISATYTWILADRYNFGQPFTSGLEYGDFTSRTLRILDPTAENSPYISKTMLVGDAAKTLGLYQFDTIMDLLISICTSFGCYFQLLQPTVDSIEISFVNRTDVIKDDCFFPSAINASISTEPKEVSEKGIFYSEATSFSGDTMDVSQSALLSEAGTPVPIKTDGKERKGNRLLFSSTAPLLIRKYGINYSFNERIVGNYGQPWNTVATTNDTFQGTEYPPNLFATKQYLHTGIYLKCPSSSPAFDSYMFKPVTGAAVFDNVDSRNQEIDVWRPAVAVEMNVVGKKIGATLGQFLTTLSELDEPYYLTEYSIQIPTIFDFKTSMIGSSSFSNLKLGSQITLQGIIYTVVKITRNISENTCDISLQNSNRFAMVEEPEELVLLKSIEHDLSSTLPIVDSSKNIKTFIAAGSIYEGCAVALNEDGEVVNALASSVHFNKVVGVALELASAGDLVRVQLSGELECAGWTLIQGEGVFLRSVFSPTNLSSIPLLDVNLTEDYFCKIGTALTATRINIQIETGFCFFPYLTS